MGSLNFAQGARSQIGRAVVLAVLGATAAVSVTAGASDLDHGELLGTWRNPADTVHITIAPCADKVCGVVVWASQDAQSDARAAGTDPLVGTNILRDFAASGPKRWRGKVFVPDLRRTVSGTILLLDAGRFRARSCALGVICKAQVWHRVQP